MFPTHQRRDRSSRHNYSNQQQNQYANPPTTQPPVYMDHHNVSVPLPPHYQNFSNPPQHQSQFSNVPVTERKNYEWTPPAALQAFQNNFDQPIQNESLQPTQQQGQDQDSIEAQPEVTLDESSEDVENCDEGFTNFLSWAKLEDPSDVSDILANDPAIGSVADVHGNTFLHGACEVGNISMLQYFLKSFPGDSAASLRRPNALGFEPIHLAAFAGMLHIVGFLLKMDSSMAYRRTQSGSSLLHLAVASNSIQLVDYLIDILDEKTIWAVNNGGSNALHLACKFGNAAIIDRLINLAGSDVNIRNAVDNTTCASLVCENFDNMMHLLVSNGAKLEVKSAVDLLGPHMKAQYHVAPVRSTDASPYVPISTESSSNVPNSLKENSLSATDEISESAENKQIEVHEKDVNYHVIEHVEEHVENEDEKENENKIVAVKEGSPQQSSTDDIHETTVDADAQLFSFVEECNLSKLESIMGVYPKILRDVNKVRAPADKNAMSLLHAAVRKGPLDVAQYLVEGIGSDVNAVDINNQTPLHYAVEACQALFVRYLVKYCGAELNIKDNNGKVALDLLPTTDSEDRTEIERIFHKSAKKSPTKRCKVAVPKFSTSS